MVIIGINKTNLFFNLGNTEFTTFYCPGWNNTRVNFLSFQFSLAHNNDGSMPNNKQCCCQLLLGVFSYTDIKSEGNFSFNICSCLVILTSQSLMSHLILSQGLGSVMSVKTCQLSSHSSSQPRSRKNVCS